ncbi:MAG: YqcC family protein [Pseudomonadales bacterium]
MANTDALYTAVAAVLIDIRAEMAALQLWQSERPSEAALASDTPFCIDTLEFTEWIQFVFLERMHAIIEAGAPLPGSCDIAPMAEAYFSEGSMCPYGLISRLKQVDDLLSGRVEASCSRARLSS